MARKKTRKEKINVKHPFLISWENSTLNKAVKRDSENNILGSKKNIKGKENTNYEANITTLRQIRIDILKSLIASSLILGMEVVLYFFWIK